MDFKVTGTRDGITACQMDIKVDGLSYDILAEALAQAKRGREHILDKLVETIAEPREDYKPSVPRFVKFSIPREFIGAVIGPGGKIIQEIQRVTGATVLISEEGDFGIVEVFAVSKDAMDKAVSWIKSIVAVPEIGEVYEGTVKAIQAYGAFVEILPGKEALLHVSELAWERVTDVSTYLKVGDKVEVKLIGVDEKTGKLRLSRKVLIPKEQ
jgi:polyribonucleotide nucleotidyltransferase